MTLVSYRRDAFRHEVDYVVVGSGAGGAAAAVTLARGGATVAVVEAGAWRDPTDYPSSAYGGMRDLLDDWGAQVTQGRALWPIVQARCVGGTTVVNSAICVRTPGDVWAQWREEHGVADEAFERACEEAQERIERELWAEPVPPAAAGRSNQLAMSGAQHLGYESHVMTRYVKGCEGSGQCLQGCRKGRKQSTNLNYVPEVRERGGIVVSCAPVERVLFEGRRAVGVRGRFRHPGRRRGGRFTIRARRGVVIAASATHSPALLLRSGLRHPALGRHFQAHPGTGVFGCYDDPVDMNRGATQGWASTAFRSSQHVKLETLAIPPELVASRFAGGGRTLMRRLADYRHVAMWCHALRARSEGRVHQLFGKPIVRYTLDRTDMERFRAGLHLVAKTHVAAGARAVIPGIHGMPFTLRANEIDTILDAPLDPRRYIAILSHLFGGCVMGANPGASVCDPHGRVRDVDSLVVADASVLPSNIGVNPQHTIMAVAQVFAERMLEA